MKRTGWLIAALLGSACLLPLASGQSPEFHVVTPLPGLGGPLRGLTPTEQAAFRAGVEEFEEVETMEEGLGPVFNGKGCAECHAHPVVGGSSKELEVSVEVRIGRRVGGAFDAMTEYGGPVLQRRSLREIDPNCPILPEQAPPEATFVSRRATPPVFGAGLIEAIPETLILQRADPGDRDGDGITGVPNRVYNPETNREELGRFGWKAHVPTLHLFSGDAYLNEMGITNPTFASENSPQGQAIPAGWDPILEAPGTLEDDGEGVDGFTSFMRFLAPASRVNDRRTARTRQFGAGLFARVGCAGCHVPAMTTGNHPVGALRRQTVALWSDLLLHDMGPELADGIEQGTATGSEWRTTPLRGLSQRVFFLHDGSARTIPDAILRHGGEAAAARARFTRLQDGERRALLAFLASL
jgi:CxxC motif-containing protein (DUF1111 family)